jgi:hypothetical protein
MLLILKEALLESQFNLDPQVLKDLPAQVLACKGDTWGSHVPSKFKHEINSATSDFPAWMISR